MKNYISARKAAKILGVSHVTVSKWCKEGRIPNVAILDNVAWIIPADISLDDIDRPSIGRPTKDDNEDGE